MSQHFIMNDGGASGCGWEHADDSKRVEAIKSFFCGLPPFYQKEHRRMKTFILLSLVVATYCKSNL